MCRIIAIIYTCTHRKEFTLSRCRGVFGHSQALEHETKQALPRDTPICRPARPVLLEMHSTQPCTNCQQVLRAAAWEKREEELEAVIQTRRGEHRMLLHYPHRAGPARIRRAREELERACGELARRREEHERAVWAETAELPHSVVMGRHKLQRKSRVDGPSPLRNELRPEDIVEERDVEGMEAVQEVQDDSGLWQVW